MKKGLKFALPVWMLFISACTKHPANGNASCISLIKGTTISSLPSNQLDSINKLFSQNNLSTANLQFIAYYRNPPSISPPEEQVGAIQFFNGLPYFGLPEYFNFYHGGQYQPFSANTINGYGGILPTGDNTGHQSLADLRTAFLNTYLQAGIAGGGGVSVDTGIYRPTPTYQDSCLQAELGYVDAVYAGDLSTRQENSLVKVWKVTGQNTYFPVVFVVDSTGKAFAQSLIIP